MKENERGTVIFRGLWPYAATIALIAAAFAFFTLIVPMKTSRMQMLMMGCAAMLAVGFAAAGFAKKRDRLEIRIALIILAGFVMRIDYMLYTSFLVRQHDVLGFNEFGHLDYVYTILTTGALPNTNQLQFYHPPLQHILEAAVVKLFSLLSPKTELMTLLESAKIVPCFAACSLLLVIQSLCREMELSKRSTAITLAILAFQPTFFLLSSGINNDAMMLLFYMIAVLYTIRWYHNPTMKNILLLAAAIGLGMMTKVSAATVAFFTAPFFLIVLIRRIKEKNAGKLFGQFGAFLGVCAPLGLWYPIRNYIKFGQPLTYVSDALSSELYVGDKSFVSRFLSFPVGEILNPQFCRPFDDFRIWIYTLKCSIFGEYDFSQHDKLAMLFILANLILILFSLAAMIYIMLKRKGISALNRFALAGLWLLQIVFFILFNLKYPFGCTMDYRYMVPTCIVGAIYLGIALDDIRGKEKRFPRILYVLAVAAVCAFAFVSVLFYIN